MNKINAIFASIFFIFMLFMSIFSKELHEKNLPHVTILKVEKKDFICNFIDENGDSYSVKRRAIGIPKYIDKNNIYIVNEDKVYGEQRYFAQKTEVFLENEYYSDDYYAVSLGLNVGDKVILTSTIPLINNTEIIIK
ncbi:MAG: hypothetical protein J6A58_09990 [Oscillospiraceae bacterium]|nr:hypothetical protein [Oscillospiraceae bacterium]